MKRLVMLSGGVDSSVLLHKLKKQDSLEGLVAVYLDLGTPPTEKEWRAAEKVASRCGVTVYRNRVPHFALGDRLFSPQELAFPGGGSDTGRLDRSLYDDPGRRLPRGQDGGGRGLPGHHQRRFRLSPQAGGVPLKKRVAALPRGKPRVGHAALALPVKKPSLLQTLRP